MTQVYSFKYNQPPINTWVWASYDIEEKNAKWQLVKTCARGCCVFSSLGSTIVPNFWYLATEEQGQEEQNYINQLSNNDIFDLYSE